MRPEGREIGIEALLERPRKLRRMDIDAEMRRKIVVSIVSVGVFFAVFIGIGATFGPDLGDTGGLALVGSIALFILVMAGAGVYLGE